MTATPAIPYARPGPVHDTQLALLVRIADDIQNGDVSEKAGLMFLQCVGPCLRELQQRRAAAQHAAQILDGSNVTALTRTSH